jgi:hypothetical protein
MAERKRGEVYLNDGDKDKGSNAGHHHVQLHVGLVLIVEAAPLLNPGHGGHGLACVQVVLQELYHEMNIFLRLIIINRYFLYMR